MHRRIQLRKYVHNIPPEEVGSLADLRTANRSTTPRLMIVSCADHGLTPSMISLARPRECEVIQTMAASVPRS
ncbi:MAG: hypothetical protein KDB00_16175, partial [Planctomycetales bacterium]|nr:hypothetical protein [Planctomycetales bacterium]